MVPVPLTGTLDGPAGSLLANTIAALRVPVPVGRNTTPTVQVPPGATGEPTHEFDVTAKSAALEPWIVTLEMLSAAFPTFVTVTACAVLCLPTLMVPKPRLVGLNWGRPTSAVPLIGTEWLPGRALSVKVNVAAKEPGAPA